METLHPDAPIAVKIGVPSTQHKAITSIKKVEEILFNTSLNIPHYQRPYKWSIKNVNQLIDDILLHSDKTAYRLGTIVMHRDRSVLNIVDGQQRLLTLSLIAFELLATEDGRKLSGHISEDLSIAELEISTTTSIQNLKRNQLHIKSRIKDFSRDTILYFFQKCELVYIELHDISEAFQFFDSQNTRGKDLAPHDLLKAFHLREMEVNTEKERIACVTQWEEVSDNLHNVFENYLFKIRQWSKAKSGLNFSKTNIDTFKGISLETTEDCNFIKPLRISHHFTEAYNTDPIRAIDRAYSHYPFQIDQVIINGKRFFEYVHFYAQLVQSIENAFSEDHSKMDSSILQYCGTDSNRAMRVIEILRTYGGRYRSGDTYVKNLFDCCILYYIDKFGSSRLDEAVIKFFLWAYTLRLEQQAVQLVSVDNHARDFQGYFKIIREAVHKNEVLHRPVKPAKYVGDKRTVKNIEDIVKMFNALNALEV